LVQDVVEVGKCKYSNEENQKEDPYVLEHLNYHPDERGSGPEEPEVVEYLEPNNKAGHSSNDNDRTPNIQVSKDY